MKPLYLKGGQPLTVKLDGPALRVSQLGRSCQRFPLTRISRVIVSGSVEWATSALLRCADSGITVSFLDGASGEMRARFFGKPNGTGTLARLWANFLDRPDHASLLREWRENARRRAIGLCALRLGCDVTTLLTRQDAFITVPPAEKRELEGLMRKLDGLIESRLLQELSRHGLSGGDADLLELIPDLAITMQWALRPDLSIWWKKRHRRHNGIDPAVAFLERAAGTVDFQLRDALHSLRRFLRRFD